MDKYLYRNKDGNIQLFYTSNNSLYHNMHLDNDTVSPAVVSRNVISNFSVTFSTNNELNLFFIPQSSKSKIVNSHFDGQYWLESDFYVSSNDILQFSVIQFTNKIGVLYAVNTNDINHYDIMLAYYENDTFTSPIKIGTAYSQNENIFKLEEISLNHFAILYKTKNDKKFNLNYVEINSVKYSKNIVISNSNFNITNECCLFANNTYFLYVKQKTYSYQVCLKSVPDFNTISDDEIVVFEGKNVDKVNLFVSNNILYICFAIGKNMMFKSTPIDSINTISKLQSFRETSTQISLAKLIGYSLPSDDFILNYVYLDSTNKLSIVDKYCTLINNSTQANYSRHETTQIEKRQQVLIAENKLLKKQLRFYEQKDNIHDQF